MGTFTEVPGHPHVEPCQLAVGVHQLQVQSISHKFELALMESGDSGLQELGALVAQARA